MSFLAAVKFKNKNKVDSSSQEPTLLEWRIDEQTCLLENIETGKEVKITPRGMEVLMHFIGRPGEVVSANDLLDLFWSRSVRSDHAVHNVIAELRSALSDSASKPRYIKTYPKRGYALIADISPHKPHADEIDVSVSKLWPTLSGFASLRLGAIVVTITVLGTLALFLQKETPVVINVNTDEPYKVIVLPFGAVDVSPAAVYLSRQLPSSLVTRLTKLPDMQVMLAKAAEPQPQGATYSLGGNVQQINGHSRVQVNLTNVESRVILFSEQFDYSSEEIFSLQDEIVQHVATALSIYLDEDSRNSMRDWGTNSALAYDAFLKAEFYGNSSNHTSFRQAIENYLAAIEQDKDFSNAYIGLANVATKMALYSHADTVEEMRKLVNFSLRELLRIDPVSSNAKAAKILALRVEGNNQPVIEQSLREDILTGSAPNFAFSHYASLLVGAGMYREAQDYLDLTPDQMPFKVSPDSTWTYRSTVQLPHNLISIKKQELLDRPEHIGILGSLARNYAFIGDRENAKRYLGKQLELDAEGPITMLSQVIISGLYGESTPEGQRLELQNYDNPSFNFSLGAKSFILGDVEQGVRRWRNLDAIETRRLFSWLSYVRIFFPESVHSDKRYSELLDELGIGLQWQKHLTEGVSEMAKITGVFSSEPSKAAYIADRRFRRNNLWRHEELCYGCVADFSNTTISME